MAKENPYLVNAIEKITIDLTQVKISTAKIEEHLGTLNGKVLKQAEQIENNRLDINKINLKIATWGGALAVIFFFVEFVANKFL